MTAPRDNLASVSVIRLQCAATEHGRISHTEPARFYKGLEYGGEPCVLIEKLSSKMRSLALEVPELMQPI